MNRFRTVLLAVLGGLLLLACGFLLGSRQARPPLPTQAHHDEKDEPGEGRVHLDAAGQKEAGITLVSVRPREVQGSFQATGELTGAPDLQVRVNARLPGRVVSLRAEPGERVRSGQVLALLESRQVAEARSARRAAGVRLQQARRSFEQRSRLARLGDEVRSALDEARQEVIEARASHHSARLAEELARRQWERLRTLREQGIASRGQLEQSWTALEQARAETERSAARLDIAEGHLAREQAIRHQGLRVSREVTEAETEVRLAEEEVRKADEALVVLGASPGEEGNEVAIPAPRGGVVVSRPVTLGEAVETDEELFTLLETSHLWLEVGIPERDLSQARVGSPVRLQVQACPGRTFLGRIDSLAPALDEGTRTARARVSIDNPEGLLKPGMFASVSVGVGVAGKVLAVPESALQTVGDQTVVYVATDAETFERRPVQPGASQDGWVEVVRGLSPGDRVAATGVFLLKSEDQRDAMGGHSD